MRNFELKRLTPIIYVVSVLILLILIFKVLLFLLPFVIAAGIVKLLNPILKKIGKKNKLLKNMVLLLFYIIVMICIALIIFKIVLECYNLTNNIINNQQEILNQVKNIFGKYENITLKLPEYSEAIINSILEKVIVYINKLALGVLNSSLNLIRSVPNIVVFTVITILSSFIILKDKDKIIEFIKYQFPESWINIGYKIKNDVLQFVFNYFKAQCVLISLCFFELLIGLSIISIYSKNLHYVLMISIFIALIDALPILGAGSVLVPWILIEIFITNNYVLALSLFILYIVVFLIRQYSEPKLISNGAGMHPLLTLIALYSGFKVFGVLGFLYGPIIAAIMKIVFSEEIKYGFFKYLINSKKEK